MCRKRWVEARSRKREKNCQVKGHSVVFLRMGHRPAMLSLVSFLTSGCYRQASGIRCRASYPYRQGHSTWRRSMAALANGFPARPSSTADLDSHLLAALSWSVQKGATLGDLSREFTANADRVLAIPLPYEPTPPLSRRLTFDPPGLSKSHQGIVMVAHCISAKDNFNRQKAKVTLSSGFVIGNGLVVTCAHTFEEVSSFVI